MLRDEAIDRVRKLRASTADDAEGRLARERAREIMAKYAITEEDLDDRDEVLDLIDASREVWRKEIAILIGKTARCGVFTGDKGITLSGAKIDVEKARRNYLRLVADVDRFALKAYASWKQLVARAYAGLYGGSTYNQWRLLRDLHLPTKAMEADQIRAWLNVFRLTSIERLTETAPPAPMPAGATSPASPAATAAPPPPPAPPPSTPAAPSQEVEDLETKTMQKTLERLGAVIAAEIYKEASARAKLAPLDPVRPPTPTSATTARAGDLMRSAGWHSMTVTEHLDPKGQPIGELLGIQDTEKTPGSFFESESDMFGELTAGWQLVSVATFDDVGIHLRIFYFIRTRS